MYEYKQKGFFAQVTGKMEELCEQELIELGTTETKTEYKGIFFKADLPTLYKINYTSRLLSRVLAPLITFPCRKPMSLFKKQRRFIGKIFVRLKKHLRLALPFQRAGLQIHFMRLNV